jgi:hypothetical protein
MTDHDPIDELLGDLRTDVPAMSGRAFAAGRTRLQAVVAPAPMVAEPEPDPTVVPVRPRRFLRSPPRLVASAAAVVALVAAVLFVQVGDNAPVASAAATQLNSAADKIDVTDQPLGPGQYRYLVTHSWNLSTFAMAGETKDGPVSGMGLSYLMEEVRELWVPADPAARECTMRSTITGNLKWVDGSAEEAEEAGIPPLEPASSETKVPCGEFDGGGWQQPSTEFLAGLPRDAGALHARLVEDIEGHGNDPDMEVLVYVADVLRSGQVPADLRAALYRALAMVPGLEITEQVANLDGHTGTAFGISRGGDRHDVIIDRDRGDFIGERQVDEDGNAGVPAGSIMSYTSVSNPVVVDQIGATG